MPDRVDPPPGDEPRNAAIRLINGLRSDLAVDVLISSGWRPPRQAEDAGDRAQRAEHRPAVTIELTEQEALALYFWTQGNESPPYWECPLDPVGRALALWYREGGYPGWRRRSDGRSGEAVR